MGIDMKDSITSKWEKVATVVAVAMTSFQVYTAFFGILESTRQRSVHLLFALLLTFLLVQINGTRTHADRKVPWYDIGFLLIALFTYGYVAINNESISSRLSYVTPLSSLQIVIGIAGILVLMEAARRILGKAFAIILVVFVLYAFFGQNIPGIFNHRGYNISWIIDHLFFTSEGILGIPLGVSATYIFVFILFGSFLERTGAGDFFIQISLAMMGKYRGGPAKTAVVASGFMGMLSGSAVANVVTTGVFTIPLMKKLKYKPEFAGAVEACASTGGQFTPPIMGAAAFIIAEFTGVPYLKIAAAAAIPAVLYYVSILFQVHFRAVKEGIVGVPVEELPSARKEFLKGFQFILPFIAIIYFLMDGYSPLKAGLYASLVLLAVTYLRTPKAIKLIDYWRVFEVSGKTIVEVAVATASAGIIIGIVSLTGVGLRLSALIMAAAGGSQLLALIITMVTAIFLGMGLPTVAAYIIQAALIVPALVTLGVPLLAAHLFAFYFAIISAVTPPVALAAYAAAGIAHSDVSKTGWAAFKLALAGFIIPFMFVYGPALLLNGTLGEIILAAVGALIGIFALAAAVEGYLLIHANWVERILLIISSLALIKQGIYTDLLGLVLLGTVFALQKYRKNEIKVKSDTVDV